MPLIPDCLLRRVAVELLVKVMVTVVLRSAAQNPRTFVEFLLAFGDVLHNTLGSRLFVRLERLGRCRFDEKGGCKLIGQNSGAILLHNLRFVRYFGHLYRLLGSHLSTSVL